MHEPVFLKEDILPFKKYEFEGRQFYSYNNIEKVLKEWYGPNCLKHWNGKKWVETLPVEKRKPKHTVDLNLKEMVQVKNKITFWVIIGIILIVAALIILNDTSFNLMGIGFMIIGLCVIILVNQKK